MLNQINYFEAMENFNDTLIDLCVYSMLGVLGFISGIYLSRLVRRLVKSNFKKN